MPVSIEVRYTAAWDEFHARVEARHTVRLQFAVVAVGGAAGAFVGAQEHGTIAQLTIGGGLAMPFLTWAFVLWARHSDLIVGLLSRYLEACEAYGDAENVSGLPGFHRREQGWIAPARKVGRYSDIADALLVVLTSIPSVVGLLLVDPSPQRALLQLSLAAAVIAQVTALLFIARKKGQRDRISSLVFAQGAHGWQVIGDADTRVAAASGRNPKGT